MKIEEVKLSEQLKCENASLWIETVLQFLVPLKQEYPNFEKWFLEKHLPGILMKERETLLFYENQKLMGVVNLKNNGIEKKICTLYIDKKYQKNNKGIYLLEHAISFLEEDKPLITIPLPILKQYKRIVKKMNWELTEVIENCYKEGITELVFNGDIHKENDLTVEKIYKKNIPNLSIVTKKSCISLYFRFLYKKLFNQKKLPIK